MKFSTMALTLLLSCTLACPALAAEQDFSSPAARSNFEQYGNMTSVDSVTTLVAAIRTKEKHDKIAYRSSGCSVGCSVGCSSGCSVGCSSGCSSGCSGW